MEISYKQQHSVATYNANSVSSLGVNVDTSVSLKFHNHVSIHFNFPGIIRANSSKMHLTSYNSSI